MVSDTLDKCLEELHPTSGSRYTNVNSTGPYGRTALHRAVRMNRLGCLELVIEAGADVNAKDKWGYTPLHLAAYFVKCDSMPILAEAGCHLNDLQPKGWTPLGIAIRDRKCKCVPMLLKIGVSGYIGTKAYDNTTCPGNGYTNKYQLEVIDVRL